MRDYGIVSPKFWIGETGKALRGDANAQLLALYLMTCPHANMIGVFHCPILYMAHETGLPFEGASKALQRLSEALFCTYDHETETIFVHRMAAFQVGESLKPEDNRVKAVTKEWQNIAPGLIQQRFTEMYGEVFHLPVEAKKTRASKAPSKPLRSQDQDQDQEQEHITPFGTAWDEYPKRDGGNSKSDALKAWNARVSAGIPESAMLAGVRRYAAFCLQKNKIGTEFVKTASAFFGPGMHFQEAWGNPTAGDDWWTAAGFETPFEANNAGCSDKTAYLWKDGQRNGVAA